MLQIKRGTDYGVRVMCHLATLAPGERAKLGELANATDVPASFLSKILQRLASAGLIASRRGVDGGFELSAPASETSLLDVVNALEGPLALNRCLMSATSCHRRPACAVHPVWSEAQARVVEVLGSFTLDQLIRPRSTGGSTGGHRP